MDKFRILSDKVTVGDVGQTVDADVFDGCNISALIDAGLIASVSVSKFSKKSDTEEQD
jgi:hypothetical protein